MMIMDPQTDARLGRPPTDAATVALIESLLEAGEKPEAIKEKAGVSLATVYNLRRFWQIRKEARQQSDQAAA